MPSGNHPREPAATPSAKRRITLWVLRGVPPTTYSMRPLAVMVDKSPPLILLRIGCVLVGRDGLRRPIRRHRVSRSKGRELVVALCYSPFAQREEVAKG